MPILRALVRGTPIPPLKPRWESSVGGNPPGRAKIPVGIETGLIRFTFQTPGSVSWKPSDQVVTAVPESAIPDDEFRRPRLKTRNSAFPRRDCSTGTGLQIADSNKFKSASGSGWP